MSTAPEVRTGKNDCPYSAQTDGRFLQAEYLTIDIYMIVLEGLKTLRHVVRTVWLVTLAGGGLFVLGHFLRQINIVVNPLVWSSAQIISALLSLTIAANVLVRYHGTGNRVSLFLGLTFGTTGLIHLGAIFEFYSHRLVGAQQFRVPLSWMIGQTLLGLIFLFAHTINKRLS